MRVRTIQALVVGCIVARTATSQRLDPIKNFCSLWDHQSVVKNGILYIYMGTETFVDSHNTTDYSEANGSYTVGYNEHVINLDLRMSWDSPAGIEVASNITADPSTGSLPPQVVRGTLYQGSQSDDSIYLYGGTTSYANTSFPGWQPPAPSTYSLWSYDPISTQWSNFDVGQVAPLRPSNGAAAEAVDQTLAFYLNGELDSGSSQETGIKNGTYELVNGMVVINTTDQTARNLSTAQISSNSARAGARMVYIPGVGEKGILVLIGGSTFPVPPNMFNGIVDLVSMTEIDVFDVASIYNSSTPDGVWYKQNATGQNVTNVPTPRVDFCLVVASAQDGSSHNIYMYGGRDSANYRFAEVWILSLPSFTWSFVANGTVQRFAHTCHLVGNRSMMSVGGVIVFQQETNKDSRCDWETNGIRVYDTSDLAWMQGFNATTPTYEVPELLISGIGGSRLGGATMKSPASNFSQDGLARLFGSAAQDGSIETSPVNHTAASRGNRTQISQNNKNEAPPHTTDQRVPMIAGTVSGVVAFVGLVIAGSVTARQWRKRHTQARARALAEDSIAEKDDDRRGLGGGVVQTEDSIPEKDDDGDVIWVELQANSLTEQPRQAGRSL